MLPKFLLRVKEKLTILKEIEVAKKKGYISFNVHGRRFFVIF